MKKCGVVLSILFVLTAWLLTFADLAAADGYYQLSEVNLPVWDGTNARLLDPATADYDYTSGDDETVGYNLPWNLPFYGQNYSHITADTNGNIWFGATDAAYSFNLANTGRGPVIAAWNNDLSSNYYGGVFIQHKTNPERVVVEWQAETYTEEGFYSPNDFAVVLYPDGSIRYDYKTFTTQSGYDAGSGISRGDGPTAVNLTAQFGNVFGLAGRSFLFTPQPVFTVTVAKDGVGTGTITSTPPGISCGTTCSGYFVAGTNVVLSATPGFGATFSAWSGTCAGTDPCNMTVDAAKSVTASFSESYAPAISITSPVGTIANSRPTLNFAVSAGTVVVKVDGIVVNKLSGAKLDTLPDGPHVVRVEATNSAGHTGFAESSFVVDTTPPAVSFTPANGSSNVPVRVSMLVRFGKQIDPASVTADTVVLATLGGSVTGELSITGDGKSMIFKPQGNLLYGTSYTLTLKAGVRDLLGNALSYIRGVAA